MADLTTKSISSLRDTLKTSTPAKGPSNHREFFAKLYGSFDVANKTEEKLDVSSGSDESSSVISVKLSSSSNNNKSTGSEEEDRLSVSGDDPPHVVPTKASPPLMPLRPFPSFVRVQPELPTAPRPVLPPTLPYVPPLHPAPSFSPAGSGAPPPPPPAPGTPNSLESTLRFADFPFPGGLAAFCKYLLRHVVVKLVQCPSGK